MGSPALVLNIFDIRFSLFQANKHEKLQIMCQNLRYLIVTLYCIHTKKLHCLRSGVEFDMNDIFYEFKYFHHF